MSDTPKRAKSNPAEPDDKDPTEATAQEGETPSAERESGQSSSVSTSATNPHEPEASRSASSGDARSAAVAAVAAQLAAEAQLEALKESGRMISKYVSQIDNFGFKESSQRQSMGLWSPESNYRPSLSSARSEIRSLIDEFENQRRRLRQDIESKAKELAVAQHSAQLNNETIGRLTDDNQELISQIEELRAKEQLSDLLPKVHEEAQRRLLDGSRLRDEFRDESARKSYVLSIDIRRSTELMLKCKEPVLYAQFIISLANTIRSIVIDNLGIYYQFTGDGALVFFPEFYSGDDAGYRAVKAARLCQYEFDQIYESHRSSFFAVITDTGLGAGIDYGDIQIVNVGGDLSIVGTPVVYACRMSGAPGGDVYANQSAFDNLISKYYKMMSFSESKINIKNESSCVAYVLSKVKDDDFMPTVPSWLADPSSSDSDGAS